MPAVQKSDCYDCGSTNASLRISYTACPDNGIYLSHEFLHRPTRFRFCDRVDHDHGGGDQYDGLANRPIPSSGTTTGSGFNPISGRWIGRGIQNGHHTA